jgi:hypothetical protein
MQMDGEGTPYGKHSTNINYPIMLFILRCIGTRVAHVREKLTWMTRTITYNMGQLLLSLAAHISIARSNVASLWHPCTFLYPPILMLPNFKGMLYQHTCSVLGRSGLQSRFLFNGID